MDLKNLAKIDLIKELGLENLSKEDQEKLLLEMGEIIQQRVMNRVAEKMSQEDQEKFLKLLEEKKESAQVAEVEGFVKEKVPEIEDIILEEIGRYKQEIKDLIDGAEKKGSE